MPHELRLACGRAGRPLRRIDRSLKIVLHVVRGPAPAQRFVELDNRDQLGAVSACQREFRIEETPLGRQHIEITRSAAFIAEIGQVESGA